MVLNHKHYSDEDESIMAEKSVFRTRMPRPVSSSKHLIVVIGCCILALVLAIFFAEHASDLSMRKDPLNNVSNTSNG